MKSIRTFAYAFVLTLSAFTFAPTPASAQDAGGTFTLSHEVYWQNAHVMPGEYRFSIESRGLSKLVAVRQISGGDASFITIANDAGSESHPGLSRLLLVSRSGKSYVSMMELPALGMTLHFAVPSETGTKEIATAETGSGASSVR